MIETSTYSLEWIYKVERNLGKKKFDPKLIEKVIYALTFLEQLKLNKLEFTFKGGTALLLATKEPKRFSIDIDIITEQNQIKIETILENISKVEVFTRWESDNDRKHIPDAPVSHYKMYYISDVDKKEEPILLDILHTPNPYPEVSEIPIEHNWIQTSGKVVSVQMPTFDSILGDKLTAFAPKTTGILYSKERPVEIIKQLFDVAFLIDNISDLNVVRNSYNKVVEEEIKFRKLDVFANHVLEDSQEACFVLSTRDVNLEEFKHLQLGISNFTNFTITRFNIEEAITASAKVAYLAEVLKNKDKVGIEKYKEPLQVKDWLIESEQFNKLNKLKKTNPEAFFYWYKTITLYAQDNLILSNQDSKSLKEAIKYFRAREGSFSSEDPLLFILEKIDSSNPFKVFNKSEIEMIIKVIDENIEFLNSYEYPELTITQAIENKQQILEPLYGLRVKSIKLVKN